MAIENPNLNPLVVDRGRGGGYDSGAYTRGLEQAAQGVVEGYNQYSTQKVTNALEDERLSFIAEAAEEERRTDEDLSTLAGSIKDIQNPTDAEITAFTSRYLRLVHAKEAGHISDTELRIRQEKILREAMARKPWLADRYVAAAGATQGYNPIGTEVQALADAALSRGKSNSDVFKQTIDKFVQLGINPATLLTNPERFFAEGIEIANGAQYLAMVTQMKDIGAAEDTIGQREARKIFNNKMVNGMMTLLPGAVSGLVNDWNDAEASGQLVNNPELIASFQKRKAALQAEWAVNGVKYNATLTELYKSFPYLDEKEFREVWSGRVSPLFDIIGTAASASEARQSTDFYLQGPWRDVLANNPSMVLGMNLIKALEPTLQNPSVMALTGEVTNRLVNQMGAIFGNADGLVMPDGRFSYAPAIRNSGVGQTEDAKGDHASAEVAREATFDAGLRYLAANGDKPEGVVGGVGAITAGLHSYNQSREMGIPRSSPEHRAKLLRTMTDEGFLKGLHAMRTDRTGKLQTPGVITQEDMVHTLRHIAMDIGSEARLEYRSGRFGEGFKQVEAYWDGTAVGFRVRPDKQSEVRQRADSPANVLVGILNRKYSAELSMYVRAHAAASVTDSYTNWNILPEASTQHALANLNQTLFGAE